MGGSNPARARKLARDPAHGVDPARKARVAGQGVRDAGQLADDLRSSDPAEVWGTLAGWVTTDPERLVAAAFAALAMVPVRHYSHRALLAWTHSIRDIPQPNA